MSHYSTDPQAGRPQRESYSIMQIHDVKVYGHQVHSHDASNHESYIHAGFYKTEMQNFHVLQFTSIQIRFLR